MYLALGENTSASIGRCVFMNRRWVCFSAISGSPSRNWKSIQGEMDWPNTFGSPSSTSWLTICCIQVVPDFDQVAMTMSLSRNWKLFQRVESIRKLTTSRVLRGQTIVSVKMALPANDNRDIDTLRAGRQIGAARSIFACDRLRLSRRNQRYAAAFRGG